MCGIAGLMLDDGPQAVESAVARMVDAQFHRGPDAGGVYTIAGSPSVCLGNRRLAIIDVSSHGNQPMVDAATGDVLVYNGEIYNFKDIGRHLEDRGVSFVGRSDTEVLFRACQHWGPEAVEKLDGMFAYAWWDGKHQRLTLVRDRLGIKPLYYSQLQGNGIAFASEVRALLASGRVERRLDLGALQSYLAYGAVQEPFTILESVRSLRAGHMLSISRTGGSQLVRYWDPPFTERGSAASVDPGVVRNALTAAVRRQLVSDVPIGVFLSGGIDSSALVGLAAAETNDLRTFTIAFAEQEFDERNVARSVADRYSTRHEEIVLTQNELLDLLPQALMAIDQPTYDGINVFVVSHAARQAGITVALSGQGGDEIFAGYSTFERIARVTGRTRSLAQASRTVGSMTARALEITPRLAASKRLGLMAAGDDPFAAYRVLRSLFGGSMRRTLAPDARADLHDGIPLEIHDDLSERVSRLHVIDAVSLLELSLYLRNTLLRDGDFMSMANSIEVRVPMLDDDVVRAVTAVPGSAKVDGVPKPLLLSAVKDLLPREVYDRPKSGFTFPWRSWLRTELRPTIAASLDQSDAGGSIGLRRGSVKDVWNAFLTERRGVDWHMVWSLYVLIDWCSKHRVTI